MLNTPRGTPLRERPRRRASSSATPKKVVSFSPQTQSISACARRWFTSPAITPARSYVGGIQAHLADLSIDESCECCFIRIASAAGADEFCACIIQIIPTLTSCRPLQTRLAPSSPG